MQKRIVSTIEWASEEDKTEAQEKAAERNLKFATYVKKHFKELPRKKAK